MWLRGNAYIPKSTVHNEISSSASFRICSRDIGTYSLTLNHARLLYSWSPLMVGCEVSVNYAGLVKVGETLGGFNWVNDKCDPLFSNLVISYFCSDNDICLVNKLISLVNFVRETHHTTII